MQITFRHGNSIATETNALLSIGFDPVQRRGFYLEKGEWMCIPSIAFRGPFEKVPRYHGDEVVEFLMWAQSLQIKAAFETMISPNIDESGLNSLGFKLFQHR